MIVYLLLLIAVTINVSNNGGTFSYVFFYADNQTADYPTTLGGKHFAELVYEKTDGSRVYPAKYYRRDFPEVLFAPGKIRISFSRKAMNFSERISIEGASFRNT